MFNVCLNLTAQRTGDNKVLSHIGAVLIPTTHYADDICNKGGIE